ncbi:Ig-like domain-containing protein [Paenibacillus sp. SC116]|uniref:Ig-like domain-containing protein n=1 Tax=Paenibacillus sp. SC116 TaxID=2968986 RepID=UPI00215B4B66|nr:Ig-like domain-containing protein [Paenibacillus sp. SC116]MCR8844789.1 Ig-like domain-containing protein [Paenibacillus sp. SC116]
MKRYLSAILAAMLILQGSLAYQTTTYAAAQSGQVTILNSGPQVVNYSPLSGNEAVQKDAVFGITFSEIVQMKDNTFITVHQAQDNREIAKIEKQDVSIHQSVASFRIPNLQANTHYYIQTGAGTFVGNSGSFAGIQGAYQWRFKTSGDANTGPITVAAQTPIHGAIGVPVNTSLELTFNKVVFANQGYITIKDQNGLVVETISITSPRVTQLGTSQIRVAGPFNLKFGVTYNVTITPGALKDGNGQDYAGLADGQWSFRTVSDANNMAPGLNGTVPYHKAGGVPVNTEMRLHFNEEVIKGTGHIYVKRLRDNETTKTINVQSGDVSVAGSTVSVNLNGLQPNTEYYVLIDKGTFHDTDGVPYGGKSTANSWNFTTEASKDSSALAVTQYMPISGSTGVSTKPQLSLTFNRPVYPGNGHVVIKKASNDQVVQESSVNSSAITGGGTNTIQIHLANALADNENYYIWISDGAFRDVNGIAYAGIQNKNTWAFKVSSDTSPPAISTVSPSDQSRNVPLNTELVMTMNKEVQLGSGSITLKRSGSYGVSVDVSVNPSNKREVRIRPRSPLASGTSYTVDIGKDAVKDMAGNSYPGLTNAWRFNTLVPDTVAPTLESVVMAKTNIIELTYNKELDGTSVPYLDNFKVTVNDEERPLSGAHIYSNKVSISLQSGIAIGQVVRISYTQGIIPLKDRNGNRVASFSSRDVTNNIEESMSRITHAVVTGSLIQLTFNEWLKQVDARAISQFTVMVDGIAYTPTSIQGGTSSTLTLTLGNVVTDGQVVTIQYQPGAYPLKDRYDANIAGFGPKYLRNSIDTKSPILVSTHVDGTKVILSYNEGLNPDILPMKSHYSVLVNDKARYVDKVEVRSNQVILTLKSSVVSRNDLVTLSYVPGTQRIVDLAGNQAPEFSVIKVGNQTDTSQPQLNKAYVSGDTVTLEFSKQLDNLSVPGQTSFSLRVDNKTESIRSVRINNTMVTLTLFNAIDQAQSIKLTYSAPYAYPLTDMSGNKIRSFSGFDVSKSSNGGNTGGTPSVGQPANTEEAAYTLFLSKVLLVKTEATTKNIDISRNKQHTNKYTVKQDHWKSSMEYAIQKGLNTVVVDVPTSEKAAMIAIPLKPIEEVMSAGKDLRIGVRYGDWMYTIALRDLSLQNISNQLNTSASSATLLLSIEKQTGQSSLYTSWLAKESGQDVTGVHEFNVSAFTSVPSVKAVDVQVKTQVNYRSSTALDKNKTIAVMLDSQAVRLGYIPTQIRSEQGAHVLQSQAPSNERIAVVNSTKTFSDTAGHWAAGDINALAGRFIADAASGDKFQPDRSVTRAEFAVMIARGLGLKGDPNQVSSFKDVSRGHADAPYIGAAVKAGIILGYEDRTFKPNDPITREHMSMMMVRAMKTAGYTQQLSKSVDSYFTRFSDRSQFASKSQATVAQALEAGIIQGMSQNTFGVRTKATRAQATSMIRRMLEKIQYM